MKVIYKEEFFSNDFFIIFIRNQKKSSSSESRASSFNNDHFTSTSNDEEIFKDMDKKHIVIFHCTMIAYNSQDCFNSHKMQKKSKAIYGPNNWCLRCFGYNVNHITSIENFEQVHIGGV
jgi:hypothetical protein